MIMIVSINSFRITFPLPHKYTPNITNGTIYDNLPINMVVGSLVF